MLVELRGRVPDSFGMTRQQLQAAARYFAECSRKRLGEAAPAWHRVCVHFIHDRMSDEVHRAIIGVAGATDVVTQAYDAIPPEEPGIEGELFVNVDQAWCVASARRGWSIARELLLYVAHGMDHLSGADDHLPEDYVRMRRRELRWIRTWCAREGIA